MSNILPGAETGQVQKLPQYEELSSRKVKATTCLQQMKEEITFLQTKECRILEQMALYG